jgi:hypothetical protein
MRPFCLQLGQYSPSPVPIIDDYFRPSLIWRWRGKRRARPIMLWRRAPARNDPPGAGESVLDGGNGSEVAVRFGLCQLVGQAACDRERGGRMIAGVRHWVVPF